MKKITKTTLIVIGILMLQQSIAQQPWLKGLNPNPTFYEIQNAFNDYRAKKSEEKKAWSEGKEGEFEQYKRWEWFWEQRVNQDGTFPKASVTFDAWRNYVNAHSESIARSVQQNGNWSFIGPTNSQGGYDGLGRISTIAFHPTDSSTLWIGTPAGGLWKTTDKGTTWTTSTDNLPVLGISDIAIHPTNPNIMYIATGDGDGGSLYGNGDTKSVGILKSVNGGATWDTTGMNWTVQTQKLIRRLALNPQNSNTLLAATSDGIYRSADAGISWSQTQTGSFIDITFKPGDGSVVYASNKGANSQIWRSADGGLTWSAVTAFNNNISRIQLAVTPANPDIVKAIASKSGINGGVYSSSNSGISFSTVYDSSAANIFGYECDGSDMTSGQGDYDLCISISPTDSNIVTIGTINTWLSTDGGSNWAIQTFWGGNNNPNNVQVVHADKHFHAFNPLNGDFWEANDGGIYTSVNGDPLVDKTNGLQISQFYKLSNSQLNPEMILGGLQDNSCKAKHYSSWGMVFPTGDGMEVLFDPLDTNICYLSGPSGIIYRTLDQFNSTSSAVSTNLPGGQHTGSWITPYVVDPNNASTIYAGYNDIFKSNDRGDTWDSISIGLSQFTLKVLAVAPSNSQTIYASDGYFLYVTTDGGASWTNPLISNDMISYISVNQYNSNNLYITCSGYSAGNKVMHSIDGGITWTNISGTLPNVPATCVILDKNTPGALYLGTDVGVFYRDSTMTDWQLYNNGLPNVIVNELEIQYSSGKLRAATFGRGVWESDLFSNQTVGIKNNKSDNGDITIYPNPNNGVFTLFAPKAKRGDKAFIYNYLGQTVKTIVLKDAKETINTEDLKSGIYYIGVDSDNYQHIPKFVITR